MQLVVVSAVSAAVSAATIIFASSSMIEFFFIACFQFWCWFDIWFNDAKVRHFFVPCKNNPDFPGYVKIWKNNLQKIIKVYLLFFPNKRFKSFSN